MQYSYYGCTVLLDLLLLVQRRGFIDGGNLVYGHHSNTHQTTSLVVG